MKWHGLAHGTGDENSYTTSLDALHVKLQRVWDTDTDWPVVGVVRLVRNIFDNLVARHYVECHQYMVDSKNFTSAAMPRCNGFPKA